MKIIAIALLGLMVGCTTSRISQPSEVHNFFELDMKLSSVDLHYFADGGTYALKLVDMQGHEMVMSLSSACFTQVITEREAHLPETAEYMKSLQQVCIYMGVPHPNFEGAEKVEYRSELEEKIIRRLLELSEANPQFEKDISKFVSVSKGNRKFDIEEG